MSADPRNATSEDRPGTTPPGGATSEDRPGTTPPGGADAPRSMDRWLGDGGMPIITALGAALEVYGADGDGWVEGTWTPTPLACNPHGVVQAGVHAVVLDAAMSFAVNAGLRPPERSRATVGLTIQLVRAARAGAALRVRGHVVRQARLIAFAEAEVTTEAAEVVSRTTATFILDRDP